MVKKHDAGIDEEAVDVASAVEDARDQEIAALKVQLAAAQAVIDGASGPVLEYPKTKYHACEVSRDHPHGYRVKRAESAEEEQRLDPEWKDSPADLLAPEADA